jgi:tRNA dimethylallyltransferase
MVPAMVATRSLSCEERRAVLIAGPTASGKSRAALAIARAFGGVVINADAMQCYRELKILTARPSDADAAQVPHRLYGHRRAAEPWSAGIFADEAAAEIAAARARRSLPVIAGGTGLYLRALERGLAPFPPIPDMVRRRWREALRRDGVAALHARLTPEDRLAIRPSDPQRVLRALEIHEVTGEPFSVHHGRHTASGILAGAGVIRIAIIPDRATLYDQIDRRSAAMMDAGALCEVKDLLALGLAPSLPAMRAIGVEALAAHLAGTIDQGDALARFQRESRNLAKRQLTWIRGQMTDFLTVATAEQAVALASDLLGPHGRPPLDGSPARG